MDKLWNVFFMPQHTATSPHNLSTILTSSQSSFNIAVLLCLQSIPPTLGFMPLIEFCTSSGGRHYVPEEIKHIAERDPDAATKIIDDLDLLERFSLQELIKSEHVEKMEGQKNLYALRISWNGMEYRILFGIFGSTYWLSNLFDKKDRKTRTNEITTALGRLNRV